jgi:hypothetical protein
VIQRKALLLLALAVCYASLPLHAGGLTPRRAGFSAGLGVNYFSQRDVTDMLNGGYHPAKKLSDFHVAVDFSGAFVLPVSSHWGLRFEYAYLLNTVNAEGMYLGTTEFTTTVHMPSVLVEYAFLDSGAYNLSVGIGGGYNFGRLHITYANLENTYSASGPGAVILLAGNTAVGEDLFVHLAGTVRVGMLGELRNVNGVSPGPGSDGSPAKLSTFALGARIGLTYYL